MSVSARPRLAVVGVGRLARTLAPAAAEAGWPVVALGSRDPASAAPLAAQLPGCQAVSPEAAVAMADWVLLCVPDTVIQPLCERLPWRPGQVALHASGATPLAALAAAGKAGAAVAGFHPLQLFASGGRARLEGCAVGIECPEALRAQLADLAHGLGLTPLWLRPESRAAYHAAANLAASGVLAVLAQARDTWAAAGLDADTALATLLPLVWGSLEAAQRQGLSGAVSGPVARGDAQVLQSHLNVLATQGAEPLALYAALARRQLHMALEAGRLDLAQAAPLQALIDAAT